jgi:hypothetical protein
MALRAFWLIVLAAFVFPGIVRADDALKLPGSGTTPKDAVKQSNVVFVGKVINAGLDGSEFNIANTEISNLQVTVLQVLRGSTPNHVAISLNVAGDETIPKAGNTYIFFVDHLTALKLLPDTDENVALVKNLTSN